VPSTIGGDGDPLDALVLSDEAAFPGFLVPGQILGVLQAEQLEGKQINRNDRLVAVPLTVKTHEPMIPTKVLDQKLISDITNLFISYNEVQGKKFKSLGFGSRQRALELVEENANERARKGNKHREYRLTLSRIPVGRANPCEWTVFYPRSSTPAPDCNQRIAVCAPRTLDGHARLVDAKIQSIYLGGLPPSDPARFSGARSVGISPDVATI
jgi:hypothetical protein